MNLFFRTFIVGKAMSSLGTANWLDRSEDYRVSLRRQIWGIVTLKQ